MSTTTKVSLVWKGFHTSATIALSIIFGWFAIMLASMFIFEPSDSVLVIVSDYSILEKLPHHIQFTAMGKNTLTLRSSEAGFVKEIYTLGGILVFPALANGCVSLRS